MTFRQCLQGAGVLVHQLFRQEIARTCLPFEPVLVRDHDSIMTEFHEALFLVGDQPLFDGRGINTHLKSVYLGWKKAKSGKSRLFYKEIIKGPLYRREGLNNGERPLLEAPWEIRVEALGRMKDLIALLEQEAKKYLDGFESKLVSSSKK